jgi:hypothetical protein
MGEIMPFKKGESGNLKGRPKGSLSDKAIAINVIFKIMNKYQDKFEQELSSLAAKDIVGFYKTFVQPLQPKKIDFFEENENKPFQIIVN